MNHISTTPSLAAGDAYEALDAISFAAKQARESLREGDCQKVKVWLSAMAMAIAAIRKELGG